MIIITFWLLPEIYKAEKRMGTLRLIWTLASLLTIIPGIIYCIAIYLLSVYSPDFGFGIAKYVGMTGWVVGLVIINYLKQEGEPDRMIAGSIRIPNKVWPVIVLVFFVFLAPGASFILNLSAALLGFVYIDEKFSKYFTLSEETVNKLEEKDWLKWLTKSSNFVSIDSSGIYLPINNPPSDNHHTITPNNNAGSFPGTGVRLGS
ncbi:hypothetical protein BDF21DRAFT_409558 [Thamnidium elegans]|nr:hypothetical protein BDF21DRAFT_409558 [Thamnidium elegans]